MALPHDAMGLSAVCDCGISLSYSLTIFVSCAKFWSILLLLAGLNTLLNWTYFMKCSMASENRDPARHNLLCLLMSYLKNADGQTDKPYTF